MLQPGSDQGHSAWAYAIRPDALSIAAYRWFLLRFRIGMRRRIQSPHVADPCIPVCRGVLHTPSTKSLHLSDETPMERALRGIVHTPPTKSMHSSVSGRIAYALNASDQRIAVFQVSPAIFEHISLIVTTSPAYQRVTRLVGIGVRAAQLLKLGRGKERHQQTGYHANYRPRWSDPSAEVLTLVAEVCPILPDTPQQRNYSARFPLGDPLWPAAKSVSTSDLSPPTDFAACAGGQGNIVIRSASYPSQRLYGMLDAQA